MKRDQQGRSPLTAILIFVMVLIVAGALWFVYKANKNADNALQKANQAQSQPQKSPQSTSTTANTAGTIAIPEWGVKAKLTDYDKVTFTVTDESGQMINGDHYDGVAKPLFKPEFLQDKTCTPGVSLYRSKTPYTTSDPSVYKKIGDYYYLVTGGPGACSNDPAHNPDDQLKTRFISEFKAANIFSMQ